jgi:hypothetical protein
VIHVLAEQTAFQRRSASSRTSPRFRPSAVDVVARLGRCRQGQAAGHTAGPSGAGVSTFGGVGRIRPIRDLTCRFPGYEPAEVCDINQTVPFPLGLTDPSNLKLLCRYHTRQMLSKRDVGDQTSELRSACSAKGTHHGGDRGFEGADVAHH